MSNSGSIYHPCDTDEKSYVADWLCTSSSTQAPSRGFLQFCQNPLSSRLELECQDLASGQNFTQSDVSYNRVRYIHTTSLGGANTDKFTFVLTDGTHTRHQETFEIKYVTQIYMTFVHMTFIYLTFVHMTFAIMNFVHIYVVYDMSFVFMAFVYLIFDLCREDFCLDNFWQNNYFQVTFIQMTYVYMTLDHRTSD